MTKTTADGPHAPRHGWLKHGNLPGDPNSAPRCGAKTRAGTACQAPAMPNGRCRLHGGKSTGPRTSEGLERCRVANWRHGMYSREALAERRRIRTLLRESSRLIAEYKRLLQKCEPAAP